MGDRDVDPDLIHDSLGQSEPILQMAARSVQPFSRRCRYSLEWAVGRPFSPQNAPSHGGSGPEFNTWFPGPTRVLNPNGISIG